MDVEHVAESLARDFEYVRKYYDDKHFNDDIYNRRRDFDHNDDHSATMLSRDDDDDDGGSRCLLQLLLSRILWNGKWRMHIHDVHSRDSDAYRFVHFLDNHYDLRLQYIDNHHSRSLLHRWLHVERSSVWDWGLRLVTADQRLLIRLPLFSTSSRCGRLHGSVHRLQSNDDDGTSWGYLRWDLLLGLVSRSARLDSNGLGRLFLFWKCAVRMHQTEYNGSC